MQKTFILSLFCLLTSVSPYTQNKCSHQYNAQTSKSIQSNQSATLLNLLNTYDLTSVDFNLQLSAQNKDISGFVTLNLKPTQNIDSLAFELHANFTIDSVFIGSLPLSNITRNQDEVYVSTPFTLLQHAPYSLRIYYHGTAPIGNSWGSGFVNTSTLGNSTTYSLSVPFQTHHWWPCKQVLTDLIDSVHMHVTTDTAFTVSSNGLRTTDINLGNGKHRVSWKTNYPINYYLISVNVGTSHLEYNTKVLLPGTADSMRIQNFLITPAAITSKKPILDTLDDFLLFFSDKFGLYPFHREKFGVVQVNLQGGMEHQTLVNLSANFDYYLAAHEMAHQWWGDAVNVDNFHDMWLNEGFASYCEFLTAEQFFPTQAAGIMNDYHITAKSNSIQRVYVDNISDFTTIYNGMVYEKGAAILHTLRYLIGNDSLFFRAMRTYHLSNQFAHTNAGIFQNHMETVTGLDLENFMQEWYYGYGFPKYSITWYGQNNQLYLALKQQSTSATTPIFHLPVQVKVKFQNGTDTLLTIPVNDSINWLQTSLPNSDSILQLVIDPNNYIINSVGPNIQDSNLVGMQELSAFEAQKLQLFPNPTQDILYIESHFSTGILKIYDMQGRILSNTSWKKGDAIHTQTLPKSIYFISLQVDEHRSQSGVFLKD